MPLWYVPREGEIWSTPTPNRRRCATWSATPGPPFWLETGHEYGELRGVMIEAEAEIHRDLDEVFGVAEAPTLRYAEGLERVEGDAREALKGQARKRVGIRFRPVRTASWDHRKLGGTYYASPAACRIWKELILSGGGGHTAAADHLHLRQAARPRRQQAGVVLRQLLVEAGVTDLGIVIAPSTGRTSARPSGTAPPSARRSPTSSRTSRPGSPTRP